MSAAATCRIRRASRPGLLGAKISHDKTTGYYKIDKILKGATGRASSARRWPSSASTSRKASTSSPSTASRPTRWSTSTRRWSNKAGKQVTLKINTRAEGEGQPRGGRRADRRRAAAVLPRLGRGQHQEGERGHGRQGRLPPRARHAAERPQRVRQALLSADPQEGADHRRARQRRRQRVADADRAAAPRDRHDRHRPQQRSRTPIRRT